MRTSTLLILVAGLFSSLDWIISAQAATPTSGEIQQLIVQLGDDSCRVRETATRKLIAIGRPAIPFLERAHNDAQDPEVRYRVQRALSTIRTSPTFLVEDLKDKD